MSFYFTSTVVLDALRVGCHILHSPIILVWVVIKTYFQYGEGRKTSEGRETGEDS